jgi:flagellar hook-associated protein 3 FlgL
MAINSIGFSGSLFGQAVQSLNNQLTNLSTQLATGEKSTTYAGMGPDEGFAVAARQQLSNISAFTNTITNVSTFIDAENTALQSLTSIAGNVQSNASTTPQNLNSTGQTIGQENAQSEFSSMVGILNTQVGNSFIFSGSATNTPSVASASNILNGNGTQAGLTQVIAERALADGTTGLGRLVISTPNTTTTGTPPATTSTASFSVSEDSAGSPFGLKLSSVSSSLTGATVSGPSGSPAAVSFSFGATNPNPGGQVTLNFNLPDGTTSSVQLTASSQNPPPSGSFTIGATPAATAANLNSALNTAIGTLANTTLVAASAVAAGNDFFDPSSSATGAVATNQQTPPAPITAATALSGAPGTNSLSAGFANGDTITVNGTTISFSSTAPTSTSGSPFVINTASGTVGNVLSAIDSITGTTTPSSIDGGAVTINTPNAASFSISASSSGAQNALAALGFSQAAGTATTTSSGTTTTTTITAIQPPLRVSSSGSVTGAVAENQGLPASAVPPAVAAVSPAPITGATALSGTGADSLAKGFQSSDTITVDGTVINFTNPSTTPGPATLTGTGLATGATPGFIDTGSGVSFTVTVGGVPSTVTLVTGSGTGTGGPPANFTANDIAGAINTANAGGTPIPGVAASVVGGQVVLTSSATGSSASITVGGADGAAIFGATTASGTAPTAFTTTAGNPPTLSLNPGDTAGTLLAAIDQITGTTTPSSINGGAITINTPNAANFSITASSSDPNAQAALAALGFSSASGTATTTAGGTNITANATSLVNGSADTVAWYTGSNSANPRASESALVDSGISVQYGIQANEQAIRQQLQGVAVYAAVTESPTGTNAAAQAAALSSRVATNLTAQPGQQQISDIQTDLANAQTTMQAASARQSQTQTVLQNMVDSTETVSTEQVASQILAIQASLSASYQTTSMLSQLTLTKFLSGGL